jgi:hypothetical protein
MNKLSRKRAIAEGVGLIALLLLLLILFVAAYDSVTGDAAPRSSLSEPAGRRIVVEGSTRDLFLKVRPMRRAGDTEDQRGNSSSTGMSRSAPVGQALTQARSS